MGEIKKKEETERMKKGYKREGCRERARRGQKG